MGEAGSATDGWLTAPEAELLDAVLVRLIPADEHGPGAREARVFDYLVGVLSSLPGPDAAEFRANLVALELLAKREHGSRFAALAEPQQNALLARLEANAATGFRPSAAAFFESVRQRAVEGMFADPVHGGNAGFAGWRLLGFPGPKGTFSAAEQALDADVRPLWRDDG